MMVLEPYGRVGRATNETSPGCRRTDPRPDGARNTAVKDLRRPFVGSGAPEGCRCHGERKGAVLAFQLRAKVAISLRMACGSSVWFTCC